MILKQSFFSFFTIFLFFLTFKVYAQGGYNLSMAACDPAIGSGVVCLSPGVVVFEPNQSTGTFLPPVAGMTIGQLQITYSLKLDASNATGFTYDKNNWGLFFGSAPGVSYSNPSIPTTGVTVTVDDSRMTSVGNNVFAGTIVVTLNFSAINNILPGNIIPTNGSVQIQPFYYNGSQTSYTSTALAFSWQSDTGAMLYGPSLSVSSQDSAFVVNLQPPTQLSAVQVKQGENTLTPTPQANTFSGYVILYWLDQNADGTPTGCRANPSGWQFVVNPVATGQAVQTSPDTCAYIPYQTDFNQGGLSSSLGCNVIENPNPPVLPFDPTVSIPSFDSNPMTVDQAAIPYTPGVTNPASLAQDSNGTPFGCYHVVYVPGTRSSWSKSNIKNGEIYGVVAWALNSAFDAQTQTIVPNYSLAHSPVSYITGTGFELASTDKTPSLTKSRTDCFVVSAASGDVNSQSVFYWRVLRDAYLTPMGITPFYYRHAQAWAAWLNEHPSLKPTVDFVLKWTGKGLYKTSLLLDRGVEKAKDVFQAVKKQVVLAFAFLQSQFQNLWAGKAEAAVVANPQYEISLMGGVLRPTTDKKYYDKFYSGHLTRHFSVGAERIWWLQNIGLSAGLAGRYTTNKNNNQVNVLGVTQSSSLLFYSLMVEALGTIRYRNSLWPYLQPSFFVGVGANRFREEVEVSGVSPPFTSDGNPTIGVTRWSPLYQFGANVDASLLSYDFFNSGTSVSFDDILSDVLLRFSASYQVNPTIALSLSGLLLSAGFVFQLQ